PGLFDYHNNALNKFFIRHPDGSNTLFATYSFTSHSIVSVNNVILADTSTVPVTVTLTAGVYGFTVSPAGMVFNSAGEPTVTVAFLLESLVGGERWARYTFLGTEPREAWRYRGRAVERWTRGDGWCPAGETDDPIGHLAQRLRALPAVPVPGLPRFTGGAVGYLGYDLVRTIERLPAPPPDTLGLPDAVLMIA